MVKQRKKGSRKRRGGKGSYANRAKARRINASTGFETCSEQLSPFGGLLALIKFFDLVGFREIFHFAYQPPCRQPKLGHYSMMAGILMLLFIGFNRIWHFVYVRIDCAASSSSPGFLQPVLSGVMWTAWGSIRPTRS